MSALSKIFPRSGLLLLSGNAVQSLVPSTLISQAESLLDAHRLDDLVGLADRQRKKLESRVQVDQDEAEELSYIYLLIGFQYFRETLFEDAGNNLFNGWLDPRILISYYPELRGNLFLSTDSVDLFAGVKDRMPTEASVEEIIVNYSPHLKPDTRSAPPTAELKRIMSETAQHMLESFLRRWRARDEVEPGHNSAQIRTVVDTVYVKLLAMGEKTGELYSLIQAEEETKTHFIVLKEVQETLTATGQYNALTMLYRQRGADELCLDLWAKLVDGTYTDPEIPVPTALSSIVSLLSSHKDRALANRYAIWLLRQGHLSQGFQLLTSIPSYPQQKRGRTKSRPKATADQQKQEEAEDLKLIEDVESAEVPSEAKLAFLEWLVLGRRRGSAELHQRLANTLLDCFLRSLEDESVLKLWRAKASAFASSSSSSNTTFLGYLSQTTPDSPHKRLRIKTILFLQGSDLYDFEQIDSRLERTQFSSILKLEKAIVEAKLANHRSTLSLLIRALHDSASAEAYCTLGGLAIVPLKTALSVVTQSGISSYSEDLPNGWTAEAIQSLFSPKTVDDKARKDLIRTLLEVYMSDDGQDSRDIKARAREQERASNLMNSQAMNLDVLDVVSIVPGNWPVTSMSSFLARSLRRTVHANYEGKITKAISSGQNIQVKDEAYPVLRDAGMLVEEPDEQSGPGDGHEEVVDEKQGSIEDVVQAHPEFNEKMGSPQWHSVAEDNLT